MKKEKDPAHWVIIQHLKNEEDLKRIRVFLEVIGDIKIPSEEIRDISSELSRISAEKCEKRKDPLEKIILNNLFHTAIQAVNE